MEFRILGPLEVADGERAISFDARKQRALLGVLLLHPNEVVSTERLIDELWGERPPATAAKVVQTYVSQLRRALGAELIATRAPGYVLRVEEGAVDAERFRRLIADARGMTMNGEREGAYRSYEKALALWRGPPLADVVFESFARNEVERLGEERLDALTARIDCELALGRQEQLVAELELLVRQYPFRERLRAQLMLALYRCGRQSDALAAFQDARRTLVDQLGLEPGRELKDLEKAILGHDPALDLPQPEDADDASVAPRTSARRRRAPLLGVAVLLLLAVALGVAFAFSRGDPPPKLLVPNSVGFIDAESGRLTKGPYPTGRMPSSIVVADNSVWVSNYMDETVTRIDRATGTDLAIPVGGHPTGLGAVRGMVWAWTFEHKLVGIDPTYGKARRTLRLHDAIARTGASAWMARARFRQSGKLTSGGHFIWLTAPPATVMRVDPGKPESHEIFVPAHGAYGPIAYRDGEVWVAGFDRVFPMNARTGDDDEGIVVGSTRSLAFGSGSLWAVSATSDPESRIATEVRRVDPDARLLEDAIPAGSDPVAVAAAGGWIWVADQRGRAILRVDPAKNEVVQKIPLGASPVALATDPKGIWVLVAE